MMKKYQGNTVMWLIVIAVIALLAVWYFMKNGLGLPQPLTQTPGTAITSKSDLDTASKQLDNTDPNQLDAGINQVATDANSF